MEEILLAAHLYEGLEEDGSQNINYQRAFNTHN